MLLDFEAASARVRELSDRYGLAVDPDARIEDVSVGMQQRVEILRALFRGAKILVLDEPTAVLTAQEAGDLFRVLEALKADGTAIVFISHKLNEVLEIADRVTVLRRGKRIDTVPTEGATEESLARLMVGREVLLRVDKPAAQPEEPVLEVRDLHVRDDRDLPAVNGATLDRPCGRDRRPRRRRRQWPVRARRRDHGAARRRHRAHHRRGQGAHERRRARDGPPRCLAHRRGPPAPRPRPELHPGREPRAARVQHAQDVAARHAPARAHARPRQGLLKEYDVRGGGPTSLATSLSGGNQQKCVHRARDRVQPARPGRRAADPRARRGRHRVRPSPPGAERDAGRGILLVSLEFEEVRSLADRIVVIYEGEIVGEFPPDVSEEELGIAMTGGGRSGGGGVSTQDPSRPRQALAGEGGPEAAATTSAARLAAYVQGGGVIVPLLTAVLAFFVGGLVILITGHNPISTYKAIFNGTGLNWIFPWVTGDERTTAALNLQQTLITTTPLILTGLAVAFAFRCGLFNIGGQGQYLVGSIVAVWVGSSFAGMPRLLHVVLAMVLATPGRRGLGGDRRPAEGGGRRPRGDLDDHAQLDRGLGGRLPVPAQRPAAELRPDAAVGAGLQRHRGERQAPGLLGRPGAAGPAHRDLHRARGGRRLLGAAQPLDHRLRGARRRLQPRGRPLRRHQRLAQLHPGHGRVRRLRRAWRARWTSSAGSSTSPPTTS